MQRCEKLGDCVVGEGDETISSTGWGALALHGDKIAAEILEVVPVKHAVLAS